MPNIYVLNEDKSLSRTQSAKNYTEEKNAESICILIPEYFKGINIKQMLITVHFGNGYKVSLSPNKSLYKGYLVYQLLINENINKKSGTLQFYISMQGVNINIETDEGKLEITER